MDGGRVAERTGVIRVLLSDEQALFREVMRVVLSREHDLTVVGEAADGLQAVAEAERLRPDVALLDADLPNCDGIRATEQIRTRFPDCQVIVLSAQEDEQILIRALEAGASGYLSKGAPMRELIDATRAVHRGDVLVPPAMLSGLLRRLIHHRDARDDALRRMAVLTRREREVLVLLAQGADNEGIAQRLVISPETARTHIQNVLGKLRVHSRLEAASVVIQNGILDDLVAVVP
jgi:DNA-binding NarL/FixJ family response regulator